MAGSSLQNYFVEALKRKLDKMEDKVQLDPKNEGKTGLFNLRTGECFVSDRHAGGKPCMVLAQFARVPDMSKHTRKYMLYTEIMNQSGATWQGSATIWVEPIPLEVFDAS